MKIKICGIRRKEDVRYLNEACPDYTGFVFAPTRREVTPVQAKELRGMLDERIQAFGVFVNAPISRIETLVEEGVIQVVQLHGDEDETYIRELKSRIHVPVIKAVRVKDQSTMLDADLLPCDFLLLDTYRKGQYGGTGESFCWDMIPRELSHPYFLAGGLEADNIEDAMRAVRGRGNCEGVDVSGGVETDGVKDKEKIQEIINIVRSYEPHKKCVQK